MVMPKTLTGTKVLWARPTVQATISWVLMHRHGPVSARREVFGS